MKSATPDLNSPIHKGWKRAISEMTERSIEGKSFSDPIEHVFFYFLKALRQRNI